MTSRKVVDLFCGAGGMSLGFQQAGFEPAYAIDFDQYACATYARNLGTHVSNLDLAKQMPQALAERILAEVGSVDVVAGGPPCQGWSVQRRGQLADARNDLTLQFGEIAIALGPRAIVMENVPTILGKRGAGHIKIIEAMLANAGYVVAKGVVDAASFGVPQFRRRAVIVAVKGGIEFAFPRPTHDPGFYRTVRDAIGDLPPPPSDGSEHPDFPNHRRVLVSRANLERLQHVPEGGGRLDVPEHLQLPCHRNANGHRHLDVFGRLWWDRPSGTITAMFDNFTRGRFAHPSQDRNITGREGARLQSFPDDFIFVGPKKDVARQIGNAVAPALARAIATALGKALDREAGGFQEMRERMMAV
ncbi:DNA cytosine methyltransferase [Sphingomonas sp.]|jgi:DNA (cytosine-5)-methyltransferase 1|uniref:DNA cytosine methyltransferase n=1 Tax=Sphingomonas sp. TaxID=28214 RepID=UPI003F729738